MGLWGTCWIRAWESGVSSLGGECRGRVDSSAFCASNTNKDDSEWELAGSTKVPVGKSAHQSRPARPDQEGRPTRCEARGVGGGQHPHSPGVLSGVACRGPPSFLQSCLLGWLWDFGCQQRSRLPGTAPGKEECRKKLDSRERCTEASQGGFWS